MKDDSPIPNPAGPLFSDIFHCKIQSLLQSQLIGEDATGLCILSQAAVIGFNSIGRVDEFPKFSRQVISEMKYICIDTISKDRNGNPDIRRVRVIPQKQEKK